jgi:pimeloyl-ACP methyl ester carboxylesterase
MNITYHDNNAKQTVVFVNGLLETKDTWEITDKKNIKFVSKLKKYSNVLTFDLTYHHYKMDFVDLVKFIDTIIEDNVEKKQLIMVGHSIGGLISQVYACLYPNKVKAILLIDSSTLNDFFKQRIIRDRNTCQIDKEIEIYDYWLSTWLNDFSLLPDITKISIKIIVTAHLNVMSDYDPIVKKFYDNDYKIFYDDHKKRMKYYKNITTRNCLSKLVLHMDVSHFIHYTRSELIFSSIKELISF